MTPTRLPEIDTIPAAVVGAIVFPLCNRATNRANRVTGHYVVPGRSPPESPIRPRPRGSVPSCHPDSTSWACAPPDIIDECLSGYGLGTDRSNVGALVVEELRRLHKGVLARYGLRLAEFAQWRARQMRM